MTEIISRFVIPFDTLNDTVAIELIKDNIMHAASLVPSGTNVELVLGPKAQYFFLMHGIKSICNFDTFYMSNILADNEIRLVSYTKCDYSDDYKIFKISGYLLAPLGSNINENTIKSMLTCVPGKPLFDRHLHVVGKEIKDWNPDLPINRPNCDMAACEAYFKDNTGWPVDIDRTVVVGSMYKPDPEEYFDKSDVTLSQEDES